ncbi:flagellar motor protein MotB [Agarivorans sp.]|uniref:flagellar motor protein MotB n=1 Tax=Agarivorans sp. TaxID=1872412 RepID=UPI003D0310DD
MRHRYATQAKRNASTERWLVSYADYMTLMFALFVVLYAMAMANEQEYPELQQRWQQAISLFDAKLSGDAVIDGDDASLISSEQAFGQSVLQQGANPDSQAEALIVEEQAILPADQFGQLAEHLAKEFKDFLKTDDIVVSYDQHWLTIELDSRLFFAKGSAYLLKPAEQVINTLAEQLRPLKNYIRVRGYTDEDSIDSALYPSNWELSAARATRVLRELQARGVNPAQLALEAYAEYANEDTDNAKRRVVIALSQNLWQEKPREQVAEPKFSAPKPRRKPDSETMLAVPLEGGGVRFTTRQEP